MLIQPIGSLSPIYAAATTLPSLEHLLVIPFIIFLTGTIGSDIAQKVSFIFLSQLLSVLKSDVIHGFSLLFALIALDELSEVALVLWVLKEHFRIASQHVIVDFLVRFLGQVVEKLQNDRVKHVGLVVIIQEDVYNSLQQTFLSQVRYECIVFYPDNGFIKLYYPHIEQFRSESSQLRHFLYGFISHGKHSEPKSMLLSTLHYDLHHERPGIL